MPKPTRTSTRAPLAPPDQLRKNLKNQDWFHIYREGDVTQLSVNLARVPPPDRSLVATSAAMELDGLDVHLLFGQGLPRSSQLSGVLNMIIGKQNLQRTLYASEEFSEQLDVFAARNDITPTFREPDPKTYPTYDRVVTERASLVSISFANDDCEWRFYRVSPTDLRAASDGLMADVLYPVVQVIMGTSELVHIWHALTKAIPREIT